MPNPSLLEENQLGPSLPMSGSECRLHAVRGSLVTDFEGDAIVNAANEGCVTGFGIDGAINRAGGFELLRARRELGGCRTGSARITPSFGLSGRVEWIVHAVGPVYRRNRFEASSPGSVGGDDGEECWAEKDALLASAYREALRLAAGANCRTVGFCLLSAGVFRGERSLEDVIGMAVDYLLSAPPQTTKGMESVYLFAYTSEEKAALEKIMVQRQQGRVYCATHI